MDADIAYGNKQSDTVYGGAGDDVVYGGQENDTVSGGAGDDHIFGNRGDDTLDGGAGDDVMAGGAGTDRFVIGLNSGADIISDFESDEIIDLSMLDLPETDFDSFKASRVTITAEGHARIDLGDGNQVTLVGVAPDDLAAGNFALF